MLEKIDVEFVGEKEFKISRTPRKLVYDFMAEYNYKRKKYGKKYVDKYIVWQGKYNGVEVIKDKNTIGFYFFKISPLCIWHSTEFQYVKEVQDV